MKIALEDGFAVQKGGGIGQHTLNLYYAMRTLLGNEEVVLLEKPFLKKIHNGFLRRAFYMLWLNGSLQYLIEKGDIDIIHFTNFLVPNVRLSKVKYAVTIHDLIAWKYPETLPWWYINYIKWAIKRSVLNADLVFTVSETIREEIIETFNVKREKIYVCYSGVSDKFLSSKANMLEIARTKEKFSIKNDFLLFVGTIEKRKNIMTLLRAFKILKENPKTQNIQLVLTGRPGYGYAEIDEYLKRYLPMDSVILTGYVSEEEKIALYDSAKIFVFPSLYEGFGTPLLEAMARGVPVVASDIPTTREIANDNVVYYGSALDYESLAKSLITLLMDRDLCIEVVKGARKRVENFSWIKIAKLHLEAYKTILEKDK